VFAHFYLEELKSSFVNGYYIATILLCQLICYEMLKFPYRNTGKAEIVENYGFARLIDIAVKDGHIPEFIAGQIHRLRTIRNSLEHTKEGWKMLELTTMIAGEA
jgi:hypothetical protein